MQSAGNRVTAAPVSPLSLWRLSAYGFITVPLSVAGLPIAIYVAPLYTDHVGLGLTVVGIALMATRLLDIVIDPLIGRWSDKTRGRFGRRAPFIVCGCPLMMLGTWKVFMPAAGATGVSLFCWLTIFYVGWALITVPYGAWGAELSGDYHERSRISGARELWSVVGLLFAVTFPLLMRPDSLKRITDEGQAVTQSIVADVASLGWATLVLLPVAAIILLVFVKQVPRPLGLEEEAGQQQYKTLLTNKPFIILLVATVLANFSAAMNQTTVVHYYRHRAGLLEDADLMIFIFFAAAVLGAFFWVWLGKRMPKHIVVALASFLNLIFLCGIVWVPKGHLTGFIVIQVGSGLAYAGPLILGASMAADVIDLDWLRSGHQRGGMFIAVWEIGRKLSEAAGVGVALPLMDAMGFDPNHGSSAASQLSLLVVNVVLPTVFAAAAIPCILLYPISERRQRTIRRAIERRLGRLAARDARRAEESEIAVIQQTLL